MGTSYEVKVVIQSPSDQRIFELRLAVEAAFDTIDQKMSTYRPDSEVSRFNELESDAPLVISRATLEVFRHARRVSEATHGAFDITIGPLVAAWGFGAGGGDLSSPEASMPTENQIRAMRLHLGWELIDVEEQATTISKRDPAVRCDLSAIAKGYAVDEAADTLVRMDVNNYLVELGGEIRASGSNEQGTPWSVAIERPLTSVRAPYRVLHLENLALATSGDYRNFYEKDGHRYSHTIDPRVGRPVSHRLASVSVVDTLCVRADAYATALMVLGEVEGFHFASENELAALFLVHDGAGGFQERTTPMFEARFGERQSSSQK